jgi:hypothetical protein
MKPTAIRDLEASLKELQQAVDLVTQLQNLSEVFPNFQAGRRQTIAEDPQQAEVYAAEAAHPQWRRGRFLSMMDLTHFVGEVTSTAWYKAQFGEKKITVSGGSPEQAHPHGGLFYISIPPISRRKMLVIHELVHAIHWRPGSRAEDHGPSFCALYLHLVALHMGGAESEDLRRLFKIKGVRVASRAVVDSVGTGRQAAWREVFEAKSQKSSIRRLTK